MAAELTTESKSSDSNSCVAERLRAAVRLGGGNKAVAAKSGVPLGTLNNYVREVHRVAPDAAAKIARACNVSIDWLLRGEGPMEYLPIGHVAADGTVVEAGPPLPIHQAEMPSIDLKNLKNPALFATLDMDRAAQALQLADAIFATTGGNPTPKERVQAMAIIYEHLTELLAKVQSENRNESKIPAVESKK